MLLIYLGWSWRSNRLMFYSVLANSHRTISERKQKPMLISKCWQPGSINQIEYAFHEHRGSITKLVVVIAIGPFFEFFVARRLGQPGVQGQGIQLRSLDTNIVFHNASSINAKSLFDEGVGMINPKFYTLFNKACREFGLWYVSTWLSVALIILPLPISTINVALYFIVSTRVLVEDINNGIINLAAVENELEWAFSTTTSKGRSIPLSASAR